MKDKSSSILSSSSLSDLIEKFSQENIIAVMEKEYQSSPARLIPTSLIDDTSVIASVPVSKATIDFFADTLQEKGFYNPLVIRKSGDRYELILGRKRFLAAKKVGMVSLPCVIAEVGDEEELLMLLADNRDMKECSVVQVGLVYQALHDRFGYTQQTLASLSHLSRPQVTNILRILRLPNDILDDISLGKLSYGHGKAIASLKEDDARELAKRIHEESLSVAEVEEIVKKRLNEQKPSKIPSFSSKFGIEHIGGRGNSLSIKFKSEEDKKAFLERLGKPEK